MENAGAPQDPNALLMQAITAIQQQLQRVVQRLDNIEQPPVNPQQAPPPRANGHDEEIEQPRVRRRGPRQDDFVEAEDDLPRHNHSQDMKLKAPTFAGRVDPEAFLEWEQRMEHIFAYYDYNEQKRLALAVAQLTDHALSWWDREVSDRRRTQAPQVCTWREMWQLMKKRYVPAYYHQNLQKKFRKLTQGTRSVEEYFEEFEHLRNRLELDEDNETLMAQFLDGLSERISHKVEQLPYHDLKDILHHAIQAEQHIKKKSYATGKNRSNQTWDQNRTKHQTPTTFPPKATDKGKAVAVDTRFNLICSNLP